MKVSVVSGVEGDGCWEQRDAKGKGPLGNRGRCAEQCLQCVRDSVVHSQASVLGAQLEGCKVAGCPSASTLGYLMRIAGTAQGAELGVTHMSLRPKCPSTEEWTRGCGICARRDNSVTLVNNGLVPFAVTGWPRDCHAE